MRSYASEKEMYPAVLAWLMKFLQERHPELSIKSYDSSQRSLAKLIQDEGLHAGLPSQWVSWDIQVDIAAFLLSESQTELAFVECKNKPTTLSDLSQLLGYSRVANPQYSFLLSPAGKSDFLVTLLQTFARHDVLKYDYPAGETSRAIVVADWIPESDSIDWNTIIAHDGFRAAHL